MWIVIKYKKKNYNILKENIIEKIGVDSIFYKPKLKFQKYSKNKIINCELDILGDYVFCFNNKLVNNNLIKTLNFAKGLKYILEGSKSSQIEISKFIDKCKSLENKEGLISKTIFETRIGEFYRFQNGPFTNKIFKIIELQKKRMKISFDNCYTNISRDNLLFCPA